MAQLKDLKVAKEALAKKARIHKLKLEIAEKQSCIAELTKLQESSAMELSLLVASQMSKDILKSKMLLLKITGSP